MRRRVAHTRTNLDPRTSQRKVHRSPNLQAKGSLRSKRQRSPKALPQMTKSQKRRQANRSPKPTAAKRRTKLPIRRRVLLRVLPLRKPAQRRQSKRSQLKGLERVAESLRRERRKTTMVRSWRRRASRHSFAFPKPFGSYL
jgi:hypothetical protein